MSWPVPAVRLIDVEATNLTVVVLFAAARLFNQTLAVVPSGRKTSPPTSTVGLLSGADVNDTEPSVAVMGLLALRESSSGRPRRHRSQRIRAALDEGRGVRETARLLNVSAAKVSDVRRMAVSATG